MSLAKSSVSIKRSVSKEAMQSYSFSLRTSFTSAALETAEQSKDDYTLVTDAMTKDLVSLKEVEHTCRFNTDPG